MCMHVVVDLINDVRVSVPIGATALDRLPVKLAGHKTNGLVAASSTQRCPTDRQTDTL